MKNINTLVIYASLLVLSCQHPRPGNETLVQIESPFLIELCPKYGTDKCADRHNFIEFYQDLFSPIKDSVTHVLEIGILNARSHLMWQEYFSDAEIYGMDINDCSRYDSTGIKTFIADQSSRDDLNAYIKKYPGPYDIIIDDGGHHMDQQQISLGFLFKYLKPGGMYVIEDLHTSTPFYYNSYDGFGVNESSDNTTLDMLTNFLINDEWQSQYLLQKEITYLSNNIKEVRILKLNNQFHSMMGVLIKDR